MAFEEEANRRNRNRSWWQQRTKMERKLVVLFVIAILIVIGLIIAIAVLASRQDKNDVCLTEGCIDASSRLFNTINLTVDPCDDFYNFACGRFIEETVLEENDPEKSNMLEISNTVTSQLKNLLETPATDVEIKPFVLVKQFYTECNNLQAIEDDNLETFRKILDHVGGWPILDERALITMDWKDIMYKFKELGLPSDQFMTMRVEYDFFNKSSRSILIDQPNFELSLEQLKAGPGDKTFEFFAQYLANIAIQLGGSPEYVKKEVEAVMTFRYNIVQAAQSDPERKRMAVMSQHQNISSLQSKSYTIPWLELVNNMISMPDKNKYVTTRENIILPGYKYLTALDWHLSRTPKRVQVNHAIFHLFRTLVQLLPDALRKMDAELLPPDARWKYCANLVNDVVPIAIGPLYVRKFFDEESKNEVTQILKDVKQQMIKSLQKSTWMDPSTRDKALEKAKTSTLLIGYPDEFLDDKKIEEYYSGLNFNTNNFLDMYQTANKFKYDKMVELFWSPVNKSDWTTRIPTVVVNAGAEFTENSIQISAGIAQGTFFNKKRPRYMNYGAMGLVAAHEITHNFDDTGKQFNQWGELENWWDPETENAFTEKSKCFIEQYGNFSYPNLGLNVNGETTLSENIADNGGLKQAYLAYLEWMRNNNPEPIIPGFEKYNQRQLFWLAAANAWCSKPSAEGLRQKLLADEHSPERVRITGTFRNLDEFSKDFHCPVGSRMNPNHKCRVW